MPLDRSRKKQELVSMTLQHKVTEQSPQDAHTHQPPLTGVNTAKKLIYTFYYQAALIE